MTPAPRHTAMIPRASRTTTGRASAWRGAATFGALVALLLSSCASIDPELDLPAPSKATGITIMIHGVDGGPEDWSPMLERRIRGLGYGRESWDTVRLDWREISDQALLSWHRGYRLGRQLARAIADRDPDYVMVHVVAHSMGAFVAQGFADTYRERNPDGLILLTFLDPFVSRGIFMPLFGRRVFGRNSDFAENYVTRRGVLLPTNSLLNRAHNFDISENLPLDRADDRDYAHIWPIYYYVRDASDSRPGLSHSPYASIPADAPARHLIPYLHTLNNLYPAGETALVK